jgi:hypothetical protein
MRYFLQRGILLAALAVIVSLVIPAVVYRKTGFKPELTAAEQAVVNFSPTQLQIDHTSWQQARLIPPVSTAPQPVTAVTSTGQLPPKIPAAPPSPPPSVSFILYDGVKSMAIINGSLVKTGDHLKDWRIERIERNRVLLQNRKGTIWLTLN